MKILIANDDGYTAKGLQALYEALEGLGELTVIAPENNCSASSNSLTVSRPLSVNQAHNGFYYVNGTPSDCIHIALTGMLDFKPDLVVSGINNGANMGDDTLYSGTVAAAMEGHLFGIPAIAFSLIERGWKHLETAVQVARELVQKTIETPLQPGTLLNVNVPAVPFETLQGNKVTRLGKRHPSEPVIKSSTPYGDPIYWIGPVGRVLDSALDTDFGATQNLHVSITPLRFDLTNYEQIAATETWVQAK